MSEEAEAGLEAARKRCESLRELKRKQAEDAEKAEAFVQTLTQLLAQAEAPVRELQQMLEEVLDKAEEKAPKPDTEAKAEEGKEPAQEQKKEAAPNAPLTAERLASLHLKSLAEAEVLTKRGSELGQLAAAATARCNEFASRRQKLLQEMSPEKQPEALAGIPALLRRLTSNQVVADRYGQALRSCHDDAQRREAGLERCWPKFFGKVLVASVGPSILGFLAVQAYSFGRLRERRPHGERPFFGSLTGTGTEFCPRQR